MSCRHYLLMTLLPFVTIQLPEPADAQTPTASAASTLDAATRREIVEAFAREMRERYVYPERGEQVAAQVAAALAAGEYDDAKTTTELARELSADASVITHDAHLQVFVEQPAQAEGPPRQAPAAEAGIARADKLTDGVGYIEVVGFPRLNAFKRVIDDSMSALSGSRALIIDIRHNGGGDPESVAYLVSFLVPRDQPINDIIFRTAGTNATTRLSFRSVATPVSFLEAPVYVLTSQDTYSGGEEFAYDIQALQRGILVGETTAGGANPASASDLGHGVTAAIPFGRVENPITKTNWDGVGVQPEVTVPADSALSVALTRAGSVPAVDIAAASIQRVFSPRTTPLPGLEAPLRNLLGAIASGASIQDIVTPQYASRIEPTLPKFRADLAELGELRSVDFYRTARFSGGDVYKLSFVNGERYMQLAVGPEGTIEEASPLLPFELAK